MKIAPALLLLPVLSATLCFASPATIHVQDGSGEPLSDVLVIIQSLDSRYRDVSRELTDEHGKARTIELKPGLYRVIATTPYGLWETEVREFLVAESPVDLTLRLRPQPTHGYGDIVPVHPPPKAQLRVLGQDGAPASGAKVLVRDKDATLYLERWYTLNKQGESKIELVASPTVLVIIYNGKLFTTQIAQTDTHPVVRFSPD